MVSEMEIPATRAACGVAEVDLAGAAIKSELTPNTIRLQARRLVRLYALNAAMAETLAPLVFLEALR